MNIAWVYFPGSCDDTLPLLCISMVRCLVSASLGKIFGLLELSKWRRYSCRTLLDWKRRRTKRNQRESQKEKDKKRERNDRLNCEEHRRCKKTTEKLGINGHDGHNGGRRKTQSKRRTSQRSRKERLNSHDRGCL